MFVKALIVFDIFISAIQGQATFFQSVKARPLSKGCLTRWLCWSIPRCCIWPTRSSLAWKESTWIR
jgi:hypothetical protein